MSACEDRVASAYVEACLAELDAPKPGNVHRFAPGHGMEVADFVRSAEVSAAPIAEKGARVGMRVRAAVEATLEAVGQNTNLGIILLCAPLAAAAEVADAALRPALAGVLDRLDKADAADVFAAIAAANPGGLGQAARHDVRAPGARRRCAKPWRRRRSGTASRASTSRPTRTYSRSACRRWRRPASGEATRPGRRSPSI